MCDEEDLKMDLDKRTWNRGGLKSTMEDIPVAVANSSLASQEITEHKYEVGDNNLAVNLKTVDCTGSNEELEETKLTAGSCQEKCPVVLAEDIQWQTSEIKTELKDFSDTSNMDMKIDLKKNNTIDFSQISTDSCVIKTHISQPDMEQALELSVTPNDQESQGNGKKERLDDDTPCTTTVSNPDEMAQEPGLKSIGNVPQLKRKRGRPLKKKTLMKMAKLMDIVPKTDFDNTHCCRVEENVPTFQREATLFSLKRETKQTTESNLKPSRRSSRTRKNSPNVTVEILEFTQALKASPVAIDSAELASQIDSQSFHEEKVLRRNRSIKKNCRFKTTLFTSEGSSPPKISKTLPVPEIVSTENGLQKTTRAGRKKTDSEAEKKCKQSISTLEPLSLNGVCQEHICNHADDEISCSFCTPTLITPINPLLQKPHKNVVHKRNTINKKCKKAMDVPFLNIAKPPILQCPSGVPNHCSLPEGSVLPSCVDKGKPNKAKRGISKANWAKKRPSQKGDYNLNTQHQSDTQPLETHPDLIYITPTKATTAKKSKRPSKGHVQNAKRVATQTQMPVPSSQSVIEARIINKKHCHSLKRKKEVMTSDSVPSKDELQTQMGLSKRLKRANLTSNLNFENKIEKKSQQKSRATKRRTGKTNNLNLSGTCPHLDVNSAVANEKLPLPALNPTITVKPKRKARLSTSCVSQPVQSKKKNQQKGKNRQKQIKTPKTKICHSQNVSNGKKDRIVSKIEKVMKKKEKDKSQLNSTVTEDKLDSPAPNPACAVNPKRKKSRITISNVALPLLPSVASTSDTVKLPESVSPYAMRSKPLQHGKVSKNKPRPPGMKRKVKNGNNLSSGKKYLKAPVFDEKVIIAPVNGRLKKRMKVVKEVLADTLSVEQKNMMTVLDQSVSFPGSNTKNISILADGTMANVSELTLGSTLWENTDAPNRGLSSQTLHDSLEVSVGACKEPCETSLTKPSTIIVKRRKPRRNRTGWNASVKTKRRLSKVNGLTTVDVVAQDADNPELLLNSSLFNSVLDETVTNTELKDQEQKLSCNPLTVRITTHNIDTSCDQVNQNVRQQTLGDKCGAQIVIGTSKRVHEQKEDINQPLLANTKLLHSNVKPRKPLTCHFCGCTFRHISAYTVHKRIHTGEKPYRCLKCGKRFARLSKLHLHSNTHRQPELVQCPCCNLGFPNKDELIVHFKRHMKGTKKFHPMIDKRRVRKIHAEPHGDDTSSPVPLNIRTSLNPSFNESMNTSQTNCLEKHYICSICGMTFRKSLSFYIHERTHWSKRPYACSVCGKYFNQLRELKRHICVHSGEIPFHCDQTFGSFASQLTQQTTKISSKTTGEADGSPVKLKDFLVKQGVDRQINTPMYFKCQICKQLHSHWCQYILHLQTHTKAHPYKCVICGQQYNQVPKMCIHCKVCCKKSGEERACNAALPEVLQAPPSSPNHTLKLHPEFVSKDYQEVLSPASSSVENCGSEHQNGGPPRNRSSLLIHGRYTCAQCGKSFNQWNKLWLHQKMHRLKGGCLKCVQCNLEFYFFGSYREHMQEHAAQSPYACPLCPTVFITKEYLSAHLCEYHKPCECVKCDTCRKCFKSLGNLEKHRLLHKGASSHYCLPCNMSFCSTCALQDHLKTHKARFINPLPVGPVEPFLYPYHCRKCKARFTSPDLLQAHQVCHLDANGKPVSNKTHTVAISRSSQISNKGNEKVFPGDSQKRALPVSKRKNMFRYPHPDRLYVVPIMSSEPPVIISDTEDPQVLASPSTHNSPIINALDIVHKAQTNCSNVSIEVSVLQPAQSTSPPTVVLVNEVKSTLCTPSTQKDTSARSADKPLSGLPSDLPSSALLDRDSVQNVLPQSRPVSRDEEADDEYEDDDLTTVVMPRKVGGDGFECVECSAFFSDVSELYEHYVHHARGVM